MKPVQLFPILSGCQVRNPRETFSSNGTKRWVFSSENGTFCSITVVKWKDKPAMEYKNKKANIHVILLTKACWFAFLWVVAFLEVLTVDYGGPYLRRQNLLFHCKTYFLTAKLFFPRQNFLSYGKIYLLTAKVSFPRQNLLSHGKTSFLLQNFLSHSKTFFSTAKLSFSRQNFLSYGKVYLLTAKVSFL